ncbi:MAG: YlxR family protein [Deltaproteobacteria bacterium]|nr:YlxR family protein [Deltaproteobacteria bacterium]
MRTKHVPIRTCLGCGQKREKGEVVRIVIKDGGLVVDESGKLPGRAAYLCPQEGCISSLLRKKGRLSYTLRVSLPYGAEEGFLRGLLREREGEE